MHTDLLASLDRFQAEMESVDEVAHVLLKGHLLIEEALSAVLEQYVFNREHLEEARLTFAQKTQLARALCLRKNKFLEWQLVLGINTLRNDLAHKLNSAERSKKLENVKTLYFREAAGFEEVEQLKRESDAVILYHACAHCAGFLSTFLADSRGFRSLLHAMDRQLNPDFPPFEL
jgi:hypothetical protein